MCLYSTTPEDNLANTVNRRLCLYTGTDTIQCPAGTYRCLYDFVLPDAGESSKQLKFSCDYTISVSLFLSAVIDSFDFTKSPRSTDWRTSRGRGEHMPDQNAHSLQEFLPSTSCCRERLRVSTPDLRLLLLS